MSLARKKRGFNRLAPRYDALVKLFFGSDLLRATTHFIDRLPPNARVLVVGGGTGNFFEALGRARPDCKVLFVDLSERMIELAQQRLAALPAKVRPQATFFCCSWDEIVPGLRADAILTPFFLDCFSDAAQPAILARLRSHLAPGGQWLFADFNVPEQGAGRGRAKLVVRLLYAGFNAICGLDVKQLPDFKRHFKDAGFVVKDEASFRRNMLVACRLVPVPG